LKTFLITGSSTGIGEACARRLDRAGHRVFAGVRRAEDGERLRAGSSERLEPVMLDVADRLSIDRARKTVETRLGEEGLDGLVNNAGIAVVGPLEHLPVDAFRRQLEVNVVGQLACTQAFLPLLRRAAGRVVFMGSIAGRMTLPFLGPYSASKFALEAIADAWRVELQPWGILVSLVEPGSIATPIWKKSSAAADALEPADRAAMMQQYGEALAAMRKEAAETARRGISPDVVGRAVEHALTAGVPRTRYLIGTDARVRALVAQFVPDRLRDWLITRALHLPRR
jgi:NAD(P)-dependent dehydrogenase (short-subunit alcohol dehydrogenase family)